MEFEFDDDDDLDEQTLAALDQIEVAWNEKEKHSLPPPEEEPPAKRRKTTTTATPSFDLDELPEISLCQDSYTFHNLRQSQPRASSASSSKPKPRQRNISRLEQIRLALASATTDPVPTPTPPAPIPARVPTPAPPASTPARVPTPAPRPTPPPAPPPASPSELEQLRLENARILAALTSATEAHTAKLGEVALLRQTIQKTAQNHAAQLASLKAAKDEAEKREGRVQRELKEEMERLKTQFIFKQHELESTSRKVPPPSVRRPPPPSTPYWGTRAAVPPQDPTPIRVYPKSPEKSRKSALLPGFENTFLLESTPKRPVGAKGKGKDKAINPEPALEIEIHQPLFQNELQSQSHTRTRTRPSDDGGFGLGMGMGMGMDIDIPPIPKVAPSSSPPRELDDDVDVDMEGDEGDMDVDVEDLDHKVQFNWKAELSRIILTHTHPSYARPTLQFLAEQSSSLSSSSHSYSSSLSQILKVISTLTSTSPSTSSLGLEGYDRPISVLTQSLVSMANVLNSQSLISPLIPLLNLLSTLIYSIPSFNAIVLTCSEEEIPPILILLRDIIKHQLPKLTGTKTKQHIDTNTNPKEHTHTDDDIPLLSSESLSLAEALCWRTPEGGVDKLDFIARDPHILMTLLHNSQPCWFLKRVMRLLTLMAIYPHLACSLLSLPTAAPASSSISTSASVSAVATGTETSGVGGIVPGIRGGVLKIPQLDRLCSFLIDGNRWGVESTPLKTQILLLLSVLSQSHPDALGALTSSNGLIPSLIMYLGSICGGIWEEVEDAEAEAEGVEFGDRKGGGEGSPSSTLKLLYQTVHLLHYLVFNTNNNTDDSASTPNKDPQNRVGRGESGPTSTLTSPPVPIDLALKLQQAPQRPFNGVTHMFTVTFGRLSYAPFPSMSTSTSSRSGGGVGQGKGKSKEGEGEGEDLVDEQYETEGIREMARDLLELVVDGPEGDSVYSAYHDEEVDEGELEEMLLGGGDIDGDL